MMKFKNCSYTKKLFFQKESWKFIHLVVGVLLVFFSTISHAKDTIIPDWPDAITCGVDHDQGAILFVHRASPTHEGTHSWYCQVYASESRCVIFRSDGSFYKKDGGGRDSILKGCQGLSIQQLYANGQAFNLNYGETIKKLTDRLDRLEKAKVPSDLTALFANGICPEGWTKTQWPYRKPIDGCSGENCKMVNAKELPGYIACKKAD